MLTYWLMYLVPSIITLYVGSKTQIKLIPWVFIGFIFIILVGLRYEVGGDWGNYLRNYQDMQGLSLVEILRYGDPGHQFFTWLSQRWNLGIYGINVLYGTIFIIGLVKFSRQMTYPWLALTVAIPYLIIVVAMGYSRQGVAIGLFLLAIVYLQEGKFKTYVLLILIAALFHKTALVLLPLGVFIYGKGGMIFRILMIIPVAYGAWDMLLADAQQNLWKNYVEAQMQSEGAKIRVAMNLIPSLLLLIYRKEWKKSFDDYQFWFWIALGSIISIALVGFASTAVDRVALYFIPIQLVVFARLPYLARKNISPSVTKILVVIMYSLVFFVWLNYATHAKYWLPYQNFLFQGLY